MASEVDKRRLEQIRARHDGASKDWHLSADGEQLVAQLLLRTKPVAVASMAEDGGWQDREFLLHAHADIEFLLRLLAAAFNKIRSMSPPEDQRAVDRRRAERRPEMEVHKNYSAECSMKCGEQAFRRYLIERHGLQDATDNIRVETRVRSLLNVQSRAELNSDPAAAKRWISLRADFDAWRRM